MSQIKEFTTSAARPLPVFLLADVSGSMAGEGKIAALNQAIREMLATFATAEELRAEIHIAIITFGDQARLHLPLQPAAQARWVDLVAAGSTPMGRAMELAAELLEDKEQIPARAYRPTVILVSDGQPTDSWDQGLMQLTQQGRAQKADRMALAIGADADEAMLKRFLGTPEKRVFRAEDTRKIKEFFQLATMSVTMRSRSINPNQVPPMQNPLSLKNF